MTQIDHGMTYGSRRSRVERLSRLADGLEQLSATWRQEARDPAVARALQDRFQSSAPELVATQATVASLLVSSFGTPNALPPRLLLRLHDSLASLAFLASAPVPVLRPQADAPIDLQVEARAVKLEGTARRLLRGLAQALAAGAVGAALLAGLPAAAATSAVTVETTASYAPLLPPPVSTPASAAEPASGPSEAIPVVAVGDLILNPETGLMEKVVEVLGGGAYVTTDKDHIILLATTVGDTFVSEEDGETYEIESVITNADGVVISITVVGGTDVIQIVNDATPDPDGTGGTGSSDFTFLSGPDDVNEFSDARRGNNGSNGSDGGGIRICVPFFGCATIGKGPSAGGAGAAGPSFTTDIGAITIHTATDNLSGVIVSSVGGDGGLGGNFYGNYQGARGGAAGAGGNIVVTSAATISTSGFNAHGIFAQSRSGSGGDGGSGYVFSSGGAGGGAGQGGSVTVYNLGGILTTNSGSMGILAQSLGGSAGDGGSSYGLVALPGYGSTGGNGGAVYVEHSGEIETRGQDAHGILAQSIGGSGGSSGAGVGLFTAGADGEAGGNGSTAEIMLLGGSRVITGGEAAFGVFAQSVGGGGGNGGVGAGVVTLGSSGGSGGVGGAVRITLEGLAFVSTAGEGSNAVVAQSVGGGGGNAGLSAGLISLGSSGDAGGAGGQVTVNSAGTIVTTGKDARGIFAQSVGGGGGSGRSTGGLVALGGAGSVGGDGGLVTVNLLDGSEITTLKAGSDAVFAQSVGGGGGSGSNTAGILSLGGAGGPGGLGGQVTVENAGLIHTYGDLARGIVAQSVGGGGGSGGDSAALGPFVSLSLGGAGGAGTHGGQVTVVHSGGIITEGDIASAIYAQSVGGGGGSGGAVASASVGAFASVNVAVGGQGGAGGLGGVVNVTVDGIISTSGTDSRGVHAQSVGGGGGDGGFAASLSIAGGPAAGSGAVTVGGTGGLGGDGGDVTILTLTGADVSTTGDRSIGLFAQSVGGGGGNGGWSGAVSVAGGVGGAGAIGVSVGGTGGGGGDGGLVVVQTKGTVHTEGLDSAGIFAQSIGGGGGTGGAALTGAIAVGEGAIAASVTLGGAGGGAGNAGDVTVNMDGLVVTEGDRSAGVFAQAVGGSGGTGGFTGNLAGAAGASAGAIAVSIGGSGGSAGDGGIVFAENAGEIYTYGEDSSGVFAQSIGGGGGAGGFSLSAGAAGGSSAGAVSIGGGGTGGAGGSGKLVTVRNIGRIETTGSRASGIFAQSVGGGGGSGGWSGAISLAGGSTAGAAALTLGGSGGVGGDGGAVDVINKGIIVTQGDDAFGVLAQSVGGGGGTGGFAISAAGSGGSTSGSVTVGGGGSGGTAGLGALVTVDNQGVINTYGDRAAGVFAQSVGGGGGAGGWSGALSAAAGSTTGAIAISLGGSGGAGGDGGEVRVVNSGQILTDGQDAAGVLAQSVGGGGGTGGASLAGSVAVGQTAGAAVLTIGGSGGPGGNGKLTSVKNSEAIETHGDRSYAIQAQSVGGGGGAGGFTGGVSAALGSGSITPALSVGIGGSGGGGGDGGEVLVENLGDALTLGDGAHGLFAQSVGGGGGSGGLSVSGALTSGSKTVNISASLGGSGGVGGIGGDVTVTNEGTAVTRGDRAYVVFAQSVGGGGGDGGMAGSLSGGLSAQDSISVALSLGGSAGSGGAAGDVSVLNQGDIGSSGADSYGIFAQSVGGGGGTGGMALSATLGDSKSKNISVAIGGTGGSGGLGGNVEVITRGTIVTSGAGATAIFAQSVGGGGGAGGSAGALSVSGGESVNLSMTVGGEGGDASRGGSVRVDNTGLIQTSGEGAFGVFAQSVGGSGGHGGMAGIDETAWSDYLAGGSGSVSFGSKSQNISVALGGFGGSGNIGGDVEVINKGAITTTGAMAHVIYAQSVGGSGGDAGVATAASGAFGASQNGTYAIGIGGQGGTGNDGGRVTVENRVTGLLHAVGDGSVGIFAQSVGGGGGAGGDARGFSLSFSTKASETAKLTSVNVSIGGQGGAAGDGGEVYVFNDGEILTEGGQAYGIFAQSVGGGGGRGGLVSTQGEEIITFLELANKGEARGGQIAIGGSGAGGGDGDLVKVVNTGLVRTLGSGSHGVFAQSIGGGGGDGGSGLAGDVSVGGQGGVAGNGGGVQVNNKGVIITRGDIARGIFAQSIGGGGGTGGATDYDGPDNYGYHQGLADTLTVAGNILAAKDLVESFGEPAYGIGIGGMGGSAGNGGLVTVTNSGGIYTRGDLSHGIFAQSVGGGGGTGGEGVITAVGQIVFSGAGGAAGDGGDVVVTNSGVIQTEGFGAYGIFAQSVGGGGGVAGDMSLGIASWGDLGVYGGEDYSDYGSFTANPLDGYGGDGGDVTVTNTGDIILLGDGAVGIFAQSVGGGGGLFGSSLGLSFAGSLGGWGDAGKVTVIQNGNVYAGGKNGIGAFFQSQAGDVLGGSAGPAAAGAPVYEAADIIVTLNGDVRGGSVYGKGVLVDGGRDNVITLLGVTSAESNLAVVATSGNDRIISRKGVIGNIDLGLGTNAFENWSSSTLASLDYIRLNGGLLTNDGTFTPGGAGKVQTTFVDGSLTQGATGSFLADLDLARTGRNGEIDHLDITGGLRAQGKVVLKIANAGYVLPGDHTVSVMHAEGPVESAGLMLVAPPSAVASFALRTTARDVNLNYVVDFSPAGFNQNLTAIGDHINAIQTAGSSAAFAPVTEQLFFEPSQANLANYYSSFSQEAYADQSAAQTFAIERFGDALMSCPASPGQEVADLGCVWFKAGVRNVTLAATKEDMAFDEASFGLSGGVERVVSEHWRLGLAASAEQVSADIPLRVSSTGGRFQFGGVAKYANGPWTAGIIVTGGASSLDTERVVILPAKVQTAAGTQQQSFAAITLRAGYRWGSDALHVRPMLELSQTAIRTDGFSETGAGALNLVVPDQTDQTSRASARIELGGEFLTQDGGAIRPFARLGASQTLSGNPSVYSASFSGAPATVNPFGVRARLDDTTLDSELGVAAVGKLGSAQLKWAGQFGDRTDNQSLSMKFTVKF